MTNPNKEYPKSPKRAECIIVTKKAHCGCVYDIRCQWNGQYWMYISDQWCKPHGSHGMELVEVKADDGKPRAAAPENPIVKILDYEQDTNNGHIPLGLISALAGRRF